MNNADSPVNTTNQVLIPLTIPINVVGVNGFIPWRETRGVRHPRYLTLDPSPGPRSQNGATAQAEDRAKSAELGSKCLVSILGCFGAAFRGACIVGVMSLRVVLVLLLFSGVSPRFFLFSFFFFRFSYKHEAGSEDLSFSAPLLFCGARLQDG